MTADPAPPRHPRAHRHRRWPLVLLWGLLLLSLGLHLWTLLTLQRVRSLAHEQLGLLYTQVGQLNGEVLSLDLPVRQTLQVTTTVPIRHTLQLTTTVPIRQQLTVPIDTTITLNEQVSIPLQAPWGEVLLPIPLRAAVPVRTTIPVTIQQDVPVSVPVELDLRVPVSVPVELDLQVPVRLPLRTTPLDAYLERLQAGLTALAAAL